MDRRTPSEIRATGSMPVAGARTVVSATAAAPSPLPDNRPDWLDEARANLPAPGRYLAFEEGSRRIVIAIEREWTRIGRSLAADVRFDDATVSRRHALVVSQPDGVRVLDDRSLNGVYVNGRRVEWSPLADGDEIVVGRHTIHYMDTAAGDPALPDSAPAAVAD
jgi:pSer/pThr/pTyr-binding forkhead associated (FHA) protein